MIGAIYNLKINGKRLNVEITDYSPADRCVGYRGDIDFRVTDDNGNDITDNINEDDVTQQLEELWATEKAEVYYDRWVDNYDY